MLGKTSFLVLAVLPALFLLPVSAVGQTSTQPAQPASIQVTATAIITAKPDQAHIEVGVVTQSATAQSATLDNAQRVDATITAIRKILGSGGEIKTIGYSVRPVYRYPKEGGVPSITGYTASNIIQVSINDLVGVGRVIDAATASGTNTIQRLEFVLKDDQAVQLQALAEAAAKAKAKAQAIASALGLRVVRILRAEEQGGYSAPPRPMNERVFAMAADAAAQPTPVEPGTVEIRATVALTVEVGL
jgi:uncharacterized protein YggE